MKRGIGDSSASGAMSSSPRVSHRFVRSLANCLWVPSALVALTCIFTYAVDIPYIDQWDGELPFLRKLAAGEAGVGDLVALQLEHRIAVNRLVALVVAWGAGWSTKACLLVTWLTACGLAINVLVLQHRTGSHVAWHRAIFGFVGGVILFGLQQYDTWLNPAMIAWFSIQFFLTSALVITIVASSEPFRFLGCMLLACIATFSASHGMLLWIVLIPVLAMSRWQQNRGLPYGWLLGWGMAAAISIACYFWGYRKPPESPSLLVGLSNVPAFTGFLLANIGAPLAFGFPAPPLILARIVGMVIIVMIASCGMITIMRRTDKDFVCRTLPWFSLMAYALLTKAAISAGRAGTGPDVALASRYMPTANLIMCALVALVPIVLDELGRGSRTEASSFAWLTARRAKGIKVGLVGGLLVTEAVGFIATLPTYANEHMRLTAAKAAVLFSRCFKDMELLANVWSPKTLEDIDAKLDFMDSRGLLRPKTFRTCRITDLPRASAARPAEHGVRGVIDQAGRVNEQAVGFGGWAIDPEKRRPADAVLLSWEDDALDATVFAIAPVGIPRPDVQAKLGNSAYARSGWGRIFPVAAMPRLPCRIRAWALDTDTGAISELTGVVEWRPDR